MSTLTTANSACAIQIENLYPVPQNIQGYSMDDAFAAADIEMGETVMGVDGKLSSGYTPNPVPFDIVLQADSPSNEIFDNWIAAEKASKEKYVANIFVRLQGTGDKYALVRGFLGTVSVMPASKKILQPRKFSITFESCDKSPI